MHHNPLRLRLQEIVDLLSPLRTSILILRSHFTHRFIGRRLQSRTFIGHRNVRRLPFGCQPEGYDCGDDVWNDVSILHAILLRLIEGRGQPNGGPRFVSNLENRAVLVSWLFRP